MQNSKEKRHKSQYWDDRTSQIRVKPVSIRTAAISRLVGTIPSHKTPSSLISRTQSSKSPSKSIKKHKSQYYDDRTTFQIRVKPISINTAAISRLIDTIHSHKTTSRTQSSKSPSKSPTKRTLQSIPPICLQRTPPRVHLPHFLQIYNTLLIFDKSKTITIETQPPSNKLSLPADVVHALCSDIRDDIREVLQKKVKEAYTVDKRSLLRPDLMPCDNAVKSFGRLFDEDRIKIVDKQNKHISTRHVHSSLTNTYAIASFIAKLTCLGIYTDCHEDSKRPIDFG